MYKFFIAIFFCMFISSAVAVAAAHRDELLHERALRNYEHFEREVREIYERSRHVTFRDFQLVLDRSNIGREEDLHDLNVPAFARSPLLQAWGSFVEACPNEDLQRLVLSTFIKYLEDWARPSDGTSSTNVEDIFRLLTNYVSNGKFAKSLMWDPENRTIWVLYFLMRWDQNILKANIFSHAENELIQKIVIIFRSLPQEDFLNLFCIAREGGRTLKEMSTYLYTWLNNTVFPGYRDYRPHPPLSLREVKTILPYAARLNIALGRVMPYGIMAEAFERLYHIPEPQRLWTLDQLVALRAVIENIPFDQVRSSVQAVEGLFRNVPRGARPTVTQEQVAAIFNRLRAEYTPERAAREAAEAAARRAGIEAPIRGRMPVVHSLAMEAHHYAGTDVEVPAGTAAACAVETSTQMRLIDAILTQVQTRLGARALVPFSEVEAALGAFSGNPAFESVLRSRTDQEQMALVYTFLKAFYPNRVRLWRAQFIRESEEAYRGRNDPTSCVKGIRERIITGLRGIDPELDRIFAQVEGRHLMRGRSTQANPRENPQGLARQLLEIGVNPTTPSAEAAALFKASFEKQLKEYGLEEDREFKGQPELLAELIEGELENKESALNRELKRQFPKFRFKKAVDRVKDQNRRRKKLAAAAEARLKKDHT